MNKVRQVSETTKGFAAIKGNEKEMKNHFSTHFSKSKAIQLIKILRLVTFRRICNA